MIVTHKDSINVLDYGNEIYTLDWLQQLQISAALLLVHFELFTILLNIRRLARMCSLTRSQYRVSRKYKDGGSIFKIIHDFNRTTLSDSNNSSPAPVPIQGRTSTSAPADLDITDVWRFVLNTHGLTRYRSISFNPVGTIYNIDKGLATVSTRAKSTKKAAANS
ncbi:hypothetical protein WAI453_010260 [Rhynchosporium graminicola]